MSKKEIEKAFSIASKEFREVLNEILGRIGTTRCYLNGEEYGSAAYELGKLGQFVIFKAEEYLDEDDEDEE